MVSIGLALFIAHWWQSCSLKAEQKKKADFYAVRRGSLYVQHEWQLTKQLETGRSYKDNNGCHFDRESLEERRKKAIMREGSCFAEKQS